MSNYNKVIPAKIYLLYYWFQRIMAWFIYCVLFRTKIELQEKTDFSKGTFLILSNHCSHMDPPLVGYAVPRPIAYMTKGDLFKVPVLRTIMHWSGAYSVSRGVGDNSFIDNTVYALEKGWLVTIFPEGGRSYDGRFMGVKSGAARILLKTKKPFLPVALIGTTNAWGKKKKVKFRTPITVKVGKMVYAEEYLPKENLTEEQSVKYINEFYEKKMLELLPEAYQPVLISEK